MNEKKKKIFEVVYICYLVLVTIDTFLVTTLFRNAIFSRTAQFLFIILEIGIMLKIYYEWNAEWHIKDILIAILTAGVFILSFFKHDVGDIIRIAFLIVGAKNIDYRKIIKVYFAVEVILFCLILGLCATGLIGNMTTYRNSESNHARMALGFTYTTALSAHILTIVVCWLFLRNKKLTIIEGVLTGIIGGAVYYLTEARIASLVLMMLCGGLILAKIFCDKDFIKKIYDIKVVKIGLIGASVWGTILGVVLGALYDHKSDTWRKINDIFSQRIVSNAKVMHRYPITLLGDNVIKHSNVYNGMSELPDYYFIVNCSYVEILYFFGILGLISVLVFWCAISYREWKMQNYYRLFIFFSLAIFFFFEQRMIEFTFNPFYVLLLATYEPEMGQKNEMRLTQEYLSGMKRLVACVLIAFLVEAFVFNFESVKTRANETISLKQCKLVMGDFYGNTDTSLFEYDYDGQKKTMYVGNIVSYTGLDSANIGLNLMTKEDNYSYHLVEDVVYTIDVSNIDTATGESEYIKTVTIKTGSASTCYIPLEIKGNSQILKFDFDFPGDYAFDMAIFEFNGKKPFEISGFRILVLFIVFGMADFVIGKNKKSKSVESE